MGDKVNVLEGAVKYFLERTLCLRFDICTCVKCRKAMVDYLLAKFPAVYVDFDNPRFREIEKRVAKDHFRDIFTEINNAIKQVNDHPPHPLDDNKEEAFQDLLNKIREVRGIDFRRYHASILKRRIALRLAAHKVKSYTEYLKILANDSGEYECLFEAMTINVSEFFRDRYIWVSLRKLIAGVLEANKADKEPVVLWSAGCANGEEAYSLAMFCRDVGGPQAQFKIYATDIDQACLECGRKGVYDAAKIEALFKPEFEEAFGFDPRQYFVADGGRYRIIDDLRALVEFKYLDLTSQDYIANVNIVFCRNVFIYFTKGLQEQILDKFYKSLRPRGLFVMGEAESLVSEARVIFKEINLGGRVYRKIDV